MTNEERKVNKLLVKVKYNSFKLKEEGQIPSFLYQRICYLGVDTPLELVRIYMELTSHFLRIKGYYKKFPEVEKELEVQFKDYLKERGYD